MWYAHGCVNLPLVVGQHWIRSSIACERSLNQNLCPRERERENKERERIYELVLKIKKNSQPSYLLLSSQIHQLLSTFPLPPHTYMCTPTPYIYIHTLACCTYIHNNSQLALSVLNISCQTIHIIYCTHMQHSYAHGSIHTRIRHTYIIGQILA